MKVVFGFKSDRQAYATKMIFDQRRNDEANVEQSGHGDD
jgi:hypothetical protein